MRVDIKDGYAHKAVAEVLCNGKVVKYASMADTDRGIIERYLTNDKGELLHIGGTMCKGELNGVVEIIFHSHWEMTEEGDYVRKYNGKRETFINPMKFLMKRYENANYT